MADLSPIAQAVLDAYGNEVGIPRPYEHERHGLAAALRSVADHGEMLYDPHEGKVSVVRVDLLIAIADELDPPSL
jgi:hypothetical protein